MDYCDLKKFLPIVKKGDGKKLFRDDSNKNLDDDDNRWIEIVAMRGKDIQEKQMKDKKTQIEFLICNVDHEFYGNVDKSKMSTVKKFDLNDVINSDDYDKTLDIYKNIIFYINENFVGQCLEHFGYKYFVPFAFPTYDIKNDTIEICYYFNKQLYELMEKGEKICIDRKKIERMYLFGYFIDAPFKIEFYDV